MKIDIIVSWPQHLDYPLWRKYIHTNRDKFKKVIVIFTDMNTGKDYRTWLQQELNNENIISISNDQVTASQDWRNVAVNKGLSMSDSEWVWFTEQDFFPDFGFWAMTISLSTHWDVIGVMQSDRLHPCSLLMKRSLLDNLDKNFGVVKDTSDHFGLIQKQLEENEERIATISQPYWHHYNGLSQNMYLLQIGQEPNYEPKKFKDYCKKCLEVELPIQPEIKELLKKYVEN